MSFKKFPDHLYELVLSADKIPLGTFTVDQDAEIEHVYMTAMVRDVPSISTEAIYLYAVRSSFPAIPIQSSSVLVSSFVSGPDCWVGNVRFDFSRQALKASDTIDLYLGANDYSFDNFGTQISAVLNYIDTGTQQFNVSSDKAAYLNIFARR